MNTPLQIHQRKHLRAVQLKQLDILCEIDRICRAEGIDYWLDGGTLLGAVRHGGFIPWDDDIDIAMRLADLPRFVEAARRNLPPHLLMQTPDTDRDVRMPIFKVRDTNSFLVEAADDFTRGYAKGLYVDIFPMMPYPAFSRRFVKRIAKLFYFGIKRACCAALWHIGSLFFNKKEYFSNTLNNNGYGIMHRTADIFPLSEIAFEGKTFRAPASPDHYLHDLYKDYMKLPPEDKRTGHAVFFCEELK